jgi:hypothetical protein
MNHNFLALLSLVFTLPVANAYGSTPVGASVGSQLMSSARVDLQSDTATLPLHLGRLTDGRKVWFILTDTNDRNVAAMLGLVAAPELNALRDSKSTRLATLDQNGDFVFESGTVDFSPKRALIAGQAPNFFPPQSFTPGSVGDANYSPFVRIKGTNLVYNAPVVAFDVDAKQISFCTGAVNYDLVHDKVARICPEKMEVSLRLGHGFAGSSVGRPVIYLSTDANDKLPATMEGATYAPAMNDLKNAGADEVLYAFANGATGTMNPERQGFNSALAGEGAPLNILDSLSQTSTSYSPLWDINVAVWTDQAVNAGHRKLLKDGHSVTAASEAGDLTNPSGGKVGSLGLLVNCPVIGFIN